MGSVHKGLDPKLAKDLKNLYGLKYFIETGTFMGRTALMASEIFDRVVTIEIDPDIRNKFLRKIVGNQRIISLLGESSTVLPEILSRLDSSALIWLDAHWSPDLGYAASAIDGKVCPLIAELEVILADDKDHVILIDDARLFTGKNGWPSLESIEKKMLANARIFEYIDDVMLSVPTKLSLHKMKN